MATRNDGVFIHQDSDFVLRLINGEVIGFIPKDGVDCALHYGSPERAKRIWPGLAEEIDAAVAKAHEQ